MTMTISEALSALDGEADEIGGEYHYVAMRISDAVNAIRSRLEVTDEMVWRTARAIFVANRPSNMTNVDWDSGAILGKDDAYRYIVLNQARAALVAALGDSP